MYNKIPYALIISLSITLIATASVHAQAFMENINYRIHFGNLNSAAGKSSDSNYNLGITVGNTAIGLNSGPNYKIKSGFQYIHPIERFTFSVSSQFVDFGTISPDEPVTRTNTLTVLNRTANGYQITAYEDHPLRLFATGAQINDTTCDSGACTETTSAAWSNPTTYGFGYRCDNIVGTDCASGFSTGTLYKQFANIEADEIPQSVMEGFTATTNSQVQITYKANISNTQPAGIYQNAITYIATPSF